jgi:hypothetical protein
MVAVFGYVASTSLLLEVEDLVFGFLDDDVEPDAEVRGYDVHHSKTSHNDVAVLDNLHLQCNRQLAGNIF